MTCPSPSCQTSISRNKSRTDFLDTYHTQLKWLNGYTWNTTKDVFVYYGKIQAGFSLRGWKDRVKKGQNATTSYSSTYYDYSLSSSPHCRYRWGLTGGYNNGESYGMPTDVNNLVNNPISAYKYANPLATSAYKTADNIAKERYFADYREKQHMAQSMVPLAEFRDFGRTVGTLASETDNVFRIIAGWTRHSSNKHYIERLADLWLTWSFGIKPMMKDAEDIATALARAKYGAHPPSLAVEGKGKNETNVYTHSATTYGIWGGLRSMVVHRADRTVASVKYHHSFHPDWFAPNTDISGIMDTLGFRISEIPSTAWELLSYSWLIDYFVNVQKVLDALALQVPNPVWGYKNSKGVAKRRYFTDGELTNENKPNIDVLSNMDLTLDTVVFERSCNEFVSLPSFRVKELSEISRNAETKLANLLATIVLERGRQNNHYRKWK